MAQQEETRGTLGLTGLTMNAMALIAPGAFLWLTFQMQSLYGAPMAGSAMWFGILFALLLCLATAYSYAELSKLYPGPGSSYLYAEQAFLSKTKAFKFARLAKFITGWASHLYYWVYPGVMVGVTAILANFLLQQFFPDTFSGTYNSPLFMAIFCVIFAFAVAYIAFRGVTGTTAVNVVINIVQISALLVFSVIAIGYRSQHPQGSTGYHLSNGVAVTYQVAQEVVKDDKGNPTPVLVDGKPSLDKDGKPVYQMQDMKDEKTGEPVAADKDGKPVKDLKLAAPFKVDYSPEGAITKDDKGNTTFNYHATAASVVAPHSFNFIFIQAAIAILILVGFETVTAMADEAKNPKKDVPRAVLLSLVIQGAVCYLIEYFAANYMLHNGYTMPMAGASGAPLGDMMLITGTWLFGSAAAGKAFMLVQAFTVFLALIGTTLSCLSTGARVTYAMGRDEEVPSHFGLLHGKTMSPYKAIWALAAISAIIGIVTVSVYMGGQSAAPAALDKHNIWYAFGIFSPEMYTKLPNTLLIMTLVSNFGTFLLYMITCVIAMVAFKEHHSFNGFKHVVIPVAGLLANLAIMLFYIVGPFTVAGMSWKEPFIALGVCAVWGLYGAIYFLKSSKKAGKEVILTAKPSTSSL
ncbi:APC family permease [Geomesophilobacter sediminis]|uniref:APC family permease n=1 Tax=Geomesophilobacter sediminis TaxID=2798584 RepID=A0A8J7JDD9_9BACT|nr:APC family permease [Geomesophilobacter sediminis]MBJ6725108.1 APC family permease [Geomesophilobacter sediminis]